MVRRLQIMLFNKNQACRIENYNWDLKFFCFDYSLDISIQDQ